MKNRKLLLLIVGLLVTFLPGCDKEENGTQKQLKLQSVGFSGIMPGGITFGKTGIIATNELSGGSVGGVDGTYLESDIIQYLSVTDTLAGSTIRIGLPPVKYQDSAIYQKDLKIIARKYYPYRIVKENLRVGDKLFVNWIDPDYDKSFTFQVSDNIHYITFVSDGRDQSDSYLKITELIEGTEPDAVLGQVRTLEVIFDFDVKVYNTLSLRAPPPQKFKGVLRMKYREI